MALTLNFRDITPEDTRILRMVALRNGKAEDYLCCDVTNEDGVTQTTWYSKADVALWGEDYIRAHTTMEYSDYTGWIISLDMEPWNDAQASPANQEKGASLPQIPTWLEGHVKEQAQKRLPTVTLCSSAGNELLEVWYYGELFTVKGEPQPYIIDGDEAPGLVAARDPESGETFVIFDNGRHGYNNLFCDLLEENAKAHPKYQGDCGDWLNWTVPDTDCNLPIFASGWGDGYYPVYFGYDAKGKVCAVYVRFIDIEACYREQE